MKKGMELPINMLVVVAVAVVVLMGVIAIYILGVGPFSQGVGLEALKNSGCAAMLREGCTMSSDSIAVSTDVNSGSYSSVVYGTQDGIVCAPGYDGYKAATGTGTGKIPAHCEIGNNLAIPVDTLLGLCAYSYGKQTDAACKAFCNCPGYY